MTEITRLAAAIIDGTLPFPAFCGLVLISLMALACVFFLIATPIAMYRDTPAYRYAARRRASDKRRAARNRR